MISDQASALAVYQAPLGRGAYVGPTDVVHTSPSPGSQRRNQPT